MQNCETCAKFLSDWREAIQDLSRRCIVYGATTTALDEERREEETARIEGARIRAESTLAALREHRRQHQEELTLGSMQATER